MKYKSEPKQITEGGARKFAIKNRKSKHLTFKTDKAICEVCGFTITTSSYKVTNPMDINGRRFPSKHIEHPKGQECKTQKK